MQIPRLCASFQTDFLTTFRVWAPAVTARLLGSAVVNDVADVGPLGSADLVQLAAVIAIAVEVLEPVGAPAARREKKNS